MSYSKSPQQIAVAAYLVLCFTTQIYAQSAGMTMSAPSTANLSGATVTLPPGGHWSLSVT